MTCPGCQQENPPQAKFCLGCGSPLDATAVLGGFYAELQVENERLTGESQGLHRSLNDALEQQAATSEVLKIISRSTLDLSSILRTVAESATRLCGAQHGHIFQFDGAVLRFAAGYGTSPELRKYFDAHPVPLGPGSASGLAASERRTLTALAEILGQSRRSRRVTLEERTIIVLESKRTRRKSRAVAAD